MARVSRKKPRQIEDFHPGEYRIYNSALYVRLSKEDNGRDNSNSIETQTELLQKYVADKPYLFPAGLYVDNGYTGTDFDRPEFNRMMDDVRDGRIDCIIVKDLSRLGRDYVEAGEFIDKICPFFGLRFISVNDNYDTVDLPAGSDLAVSLKNVINDVYAKDISRKVSSVLKEKRLRGDYIGSYAPYGYLKSPVNKNQLIVDKEIAPIVVKIFEMRASGMGIDRIAKALNEAGYPSPGRLRYERGIITNNNKKGKALLWGRHILNDILRNVAYIGHLEQGRSGSCLYKGIPFHWVDKDDWDRAENTQEPIIGMELWDAVQAVNTTRSEQAKKNTGKYSQFPPAKSLYGKILVCSDCGRPMKMVRSFSTDKTKAYYNYRCPTYIESGELGCINKSIRAVDLDQTILTIIQKQLVVFLDAQKALQQLIAIEKAKVKQSSPVSKLHRLEKELKQKKTLFTGLYTDLKEGILSRDEYDFAKQKYQSEISQIEQQITELKSLLKDSVDTVFGERNWDSFVKKYLEQDELTAEMITAMIEKIKLSANNSISIEFKYMNELELLMSVCDKLRRESA